MNQIEVLGRFHFFQAPSPWFANAGDADVVLIPESVRSPVTRNGTPLQDSCLGNPMGKGAWRTTVHRVAKSQTWLKHLSTHACTYIFLHIHAYTHMHITLRLPLRIKKLKKANSGTSLVVQWLKLCFLMQRAWVKSLVGGRRSQMIHSQERKQK